MALQRVFTVNGKRYHRDKTECGQGGNAVVFPAYCNEEKYALKVLKKNPTSVAEYRFLNEIDMLVDLEEIAGVMPIYDYYKGAKNCPPFYVMPYGTPAAEFLRDKEQVDVIKACSVLAETLSKLEEREISHRDIKPDNIMFIEGVPVLSDFGLAYKQGNPRLTQSDAKQMGARLTMAPEMLRAPYDADYVKADVYSLAKTMWILLTGRTEGFDGCYHTHSPESLWECDVEVLGKLEQCLTACTDSNPLNRWSFLEFKAACDDWLKIYQDGILRRRERWKLLKQRIFPYSQPEKASWSDPKDICSVLNLILKHKCWGYSFFPRGGDLAFEGARESHENGCIEFIGGRHPHIIRPKSLSFFSPGRDKMNDQDYFLLHADTLNPVSNYYAAGDEPLTELAPRKYTNPECADWNDYNGLDLPEGARAVTRYSQGTFGIFMGDSIYSRYGVYTDKGLEKSYSAPHNKYSEEDFFNYFKRMIEHLSPNKTDLNTEVLAFVPINKTKLKRTKLTHEQLGLVTSFVTKLKATNEYQSTIEKIENGTETCVRTASDYSFEDLFSSESELEDIINEYSEIDLQLFNAVMYAGQDNQPPFGVPLDEMILLHADHQSNYNALKSKGAYTVCQYIESGVTMYS